MGQPALIMDSSTDFTTDLENVRMIREVSARALSGRDVSLQISGFVSTSFSLCRSQR